MNHLRLYNQGNIAAKRPGALIVGNCGTLLHDLSGVYRNLGRNRAADVHGIRSTESIATELQMSWPFCASG